MSFFANLRRSFLQGIPWKRRSKMTEKKNLYPYLDNQVWLRSNEHEVPEPVEAQVTGVIPEWLSGSVVRNGPGATHIDGQVKYNHLFDGPAMLHRYGISGGRVTYQCRWVRSHMLQESRAARRVVYSEFGTRAVPDPCQSIFRRMALGYNFDMVSDNTSIAVYPIGDELYAFSETSVIHRIETESLDTLERINVQKKENIALVHHSAHPLILPNGDVYNVGLSVTKGKPTHTIVKFPAKTKDMFESATVVATMTPRWPMNPCYMHSFGVTDNYWVIIEQPFTISMKKALWSKFYSGEPVNKWFKWAPKEDTNIVLLHRSSGKEAARFKCRALFFMHAINTFERDGFLHLDLCVFRDANALKALYLHALENAQSNKDYADWLRSRPIRFKLPLTAETLKPGAKPTPVEPELIVDVGMEMPRFNDTLFLGKPYRYFYALSTDLDKPGHGSLLKVDRETGQVWYWSEPDCFPSEPVFVPRPGATEEEDGVVVSALQWSGRASAAALLVLDARSFRESARASLTVPGPHVRTFHGCFRPAPPTPPAPPATPTTPTTTPTA